MRFSEDIEIKTNLIITARERGKIVDRREGHNIWVDLGREYLAQLIAFTSLSPDTPERDDRIKYMGFGIGGTQQLAATIANNTPMSDHYPGTNNQTDIDPTVTALERPVRISGTTTAPGDPYDPTDVWLGSIQAPATRLTSTETTFTRVVTQDEISYGIFTRVPLSEIGLFTSATNPVGTPGNTLVAYDTFDTLSKTTATEFEINWTIRF